jgi:hypothetical protein
LIQRLVKAPDKGREGVLLAAEAVSAIKAAGFSGVMLQTLGWEHRLPEIIAAIK